MEGGSEPVSTSKSARNGGNLKAPESRSSRYWLGDWSLRKDDRERSEIRRSSSGSAQQSETNRTRPPSERMMDSAAAGNPVLTVRSGAKVKMSEISLRAASRKMDRQRCSRS